MRKLEFMIDVKKNRARTCEEAGTLCANNVEIHELSTTSRSENSSGYRWIIEAGGMKEGKMDLCGDLKSYEQLSSNSHGCVSPPSSTVTLDVTEVGKLTSPGSREYVIIEKSPESTVLNPQNSNSVGTLKDAEGGSLNHRDFIQRQITNQSTMTSNPPKLALKYRLPPKVPQSESCMAPGTGVYYTSRRSITSKGYGKVCIVEALSLLADVSCNLKRSHQQSSNSTPKFSKNVAEKRFNQGQWDRPREKKMASAEKNGSHPYCKERSNQKSSKKMPLLAKDNSYEVVRKHRTPRKTSKPMFHCPNKIQKNKSLSRCDEYSSRIASSRSMTDTNHICESLATSEASAICSEKNKENLLGEVVFSDDKSGTNIIQITQAVQRAATLERVSKVLYQLCSTKKKTFRGFKRGERFTHQILRFIGETAVPERLIRQALGNNPDTSKALRLLLTERKVMRLGSGGRGQAYEYAATEKGLHQLHELEQEVTEVVELTPEYASASSWSSAAGALIISGASKSEVQCFSIEDPRNWKAPAADTHESRPSSVTPPVTPTVTPHRSFKCPVHCLNCVTSTESFDLQSSEVTEC